MQHRYEYHPEVSRPTALMPFELIPSLFIYRSGYILAGHEGEVVYIRPSELISVV